MGERTVAWATGRAASQGQFLAQDGRIQQRYEALRAYVLLPSFARPRTSAERFDLRRFERFGLLGLLDRDPVGVAWGTASVRNFQVEMIPVGTQDAGDRARRLYAFLHHLIVVAEGGEHGSSGPLRPCFHRDAGERADDSESARRHLAVR